MDGGLGIKDSGLRLSTFDSRLGLAGSRLSTFDSRLGLSVEQISQSYGDHHHRAGDLGFFPDAALDQFGAGLVVGDHVEDSARVACLPRGPDTASGDRVALHE
jgi:hypothetical protein